MIPVTIVDNFYEDPYSIREYALRQQFTTSGVISPIEKSKNLVSR